MDQNKQVLERSGRRSRGRIAAILAAVAIASGLLWGGLVFAPTHGEQGNSHATTLALSAGIEVLGVTYPTVSGHWGSAQLTASVSGNIGSYSCAWTFGDGGSSNLCSPSHSWTSGGTFAVDLTVTNGANQAAASITVGANAGYITGTAGGMSPKSPHASIIQWSWVMTFPCKGVALGGFPGQPCGVPVQFPVILAGNTITSLGVTYGWTADSTSGVLNGQVAIYNYGAAGTYVATQTAVDGGYQFSISAAAVE